MEIRGIPIVVALFSDLKGGITEVVWKLLMKFMTNLSYSRLSCNSNLTEVHISKLGKLPKNNYG